MKALEIYMEMQADIIFCKKTKTKLRCSFTSAAVLGIVECTNPLSFFALAMSQTHFLVQMYSDVQVH